MSANNGDDPKVKNKTNPTPDLLQKTADFKPIKFIEGEEKRIAKDRTIVDAGTAVVYDFSGKIITRGNLKNLSPSGAGIEVQPVIIESGAKIVIEFLGNGLKVASVQATVQWVKVIPNHPQNFKQLGIKFVNPTPALKKTLENYFEEIKKQAKVWT